jgi:hypothetical protein
MHKLSKLTFDTNVLFDIFEGRNNKKYIDQLKQLHDTGVLQINIAATSGAENRPDGLAVKNMDRFKELIDSIGFSNVSILNPIFYWDFSFYGYAVYASEEMIELESNIFQVLFKDTAYNYRDFCALNNADKDKIDPDWLNKMCDTQIMWCHINYGGDIFVTSDKNLHKATKKPLLIGLGAKGIMYPKEACEYFISQR